MLLPADVIAPGRAHEPQGSRGLFPFPDRDQTADVYAGPLLAGVVVGVRSHAQRTIPHPARTAKVHRQLAALCSVRVEPELIGALRHKRDVMPWPLACLSARAQIPCREGGR